MATIEITIPVDKDRPISDQELRDNPGLALFALAGIETWQEMDDMLTLYEAGLRYSAAIDSVVATRELLSYRKGFWGRVREWIQG